MPMDEGVIKGLSSVWDSCKAQEDQKNELITKLFACIDDLSAKLMEAETELDDKKDLIKLHRERLKDSEKQVQAFRIEKDRYVYVSALLDGDCMPFNDELVKQGKEGGKRTAALLKEAIQSELQHSLPSAAHYAAISVRVYANIKGLAKTYKDMDIISEATYFTEFVRGFNMGDPLFSFVDAGDGKECSDHKIKANFDHDLADIHCKKIIFGGSADNGYARLLDPLAENESTRERIILLEGPPFAYELVKIKDKFRNNAFESVFRDQKLVDLGRRVSFHVTPPSTPATHYATAAAKAVSGQASEPRPALPAQPRSSGSTPVAKDEILRNKQGQRLDPYIRYSQPDFILLKSRKLCNNYHLLGTCPYSEAYGSCHHTHGDKLNNKQLEILRAIARQSPCNAGIYCDDPTCVSGHRCLRDGCSGANCWFPLEMHGIDTKVKV